MTQDVTINVKVPNNIKGILKRLRKAYPKCNVSISSNNMLYTSMDDVTVQYWVHVSPEACAHIDSFEDVKKYAAYLISKAETNVS